MPSTDRTVVSGPEKSAGAFRTIGEVSEQTGLPQHILRYWETRFSQLKPLQRAGNRRYYRPEDVALVQRIDTLLNREGYTIRGVQQLLSRKTPATAGASQPPAAVAAPISSSPELPTTSLDALRRLRDRLDEALRAS